MTLSELFPKVKAVCPEAKLHPETEATAELIATENHIIHATLGAYHPDEFWIIERKTDAKTPGYYPVDEIIEILKTGK